MDRNQKTPTLASRASTCAATISIPTTSIVVVVVGGGGGGGGGATVTTELGTVVLGPVGVFTGADALSVSLTITALVGACSAGTSTSTN